MQGSAKRSSRIGVAIAFAIAFTAASTLIFWLAAATGSFLRLTALPLPTRLSIAAVSFIALAALDVVAIRRATYCPLTLRRQTPRKLLRGRDMRLVALIWGFDTGLVVTTFRVAAISWGALLLAFLGVSNTWSGFAYALGFTIPFLVLILRPVLRDPARDPGLTIMLARRPLLQGVSAVMLIMGGVLASAQKIA